MLKHFSSFEEVAADEDFQAWHAGDNNSHAVRWQEWLANNSQYKPLVDEAVHYLNAISITDKPVLSEQIETAHLRLMHTIDGSTPVIKINRSRKLFWLSAAAVILVIAGAAIWYNVWSNSQQLKLNTAYGHIEQYKLPDGSEVMLNANSKLLMKKWEEGKDREVWIEGEAFFHVRKTSAKNRFVVHTKEMDIIVTGTQFNVVNREGESNVLLKEGSVTLKTNDGRLINMMPSDYVTVTNSLPKKEKAPQEKILAWTQAKLVFENTSMHEVQKIITQHYGLNVQLDKNVGEKTISGILPNDNLEVLLKALEATTEFHIERKGEEIFISASQQ